jgi:hypothetical protein
VTDDKDRSPEGFEDAFEAIIDDPEQNPIKVYVEVSPIDPWDDILHDGRIKYRSLADAYEAYRRERELREGQSDE